MVNNKLSDEQRKLIDHLMNTDISKNTAICLVFIAGREETKSREIENATRLRQPEVSIAMQDLREREWIEKRNIKKGGKGRPVHGYKLAKPIEEILSEIEEEEEDKIKEIRDNLDQIKSLIDSIY